jgi:lysozyme
MGQITGIDCSQYQGIIDWDKAKAAGAQFAFIRACFGSSKDTQFDRNWAESKRVGIPRGAYGWVINGVNQQINAQRFKNFVGEDVGDLPPVCDFEKYMSGGVVKMPTFGELRTFVEQTELLFKRIPFIYSSTGYWRSLPNSTTQTWAVRYPYWHAQYTSAANPVIPAPFPKWTFWQWSADGNGKGKEYGAQSSAIDLNRFNGDIVDFQKLLGVEVIEPEPNPPVTPPSDLAVRVEKLEKWARGIGYEG